MRTIYCSRFSGRRLLVGFLGRLRRCFTIISGLSNELSSFHQLHGADGQGVFD